MDRRASWVSFVLVSVFVMGIFARFLPPTEENRLILLSVQQLLFIVGGIKGASPRAMYSRPKRKDWISGILSGVGLYIINTILGMVCVWIAMQILDYDLVQSLILQERSSAAALLTSNKPLIFFGMVLLLTVGAPLGEELFFRGLLVDLWKERYGAKRAVFFAALIFALLHFYVLQFVPVLIAGILLGVLFIRSKNLFVPFLAHSIVNSLVLVFWLFNL